MRSICRVFISDSSTLRSFYWFEQSADQSIYFGSSNTKHFRNGYAGTGMSSATGDTHVEPTRDGRRMTSDELKQKNSIHGSGVVNLGTLANGRRERFEIHPPRDGFEVLPLIAILPMHPALYPVSTKTPKSTDLIIETGSDSPLPFGSIFYVNRTEELEPPPIGRAKSMYRMFATESVGFGAGRLCVSIYAEPSRLRWWPQLEGSILASPQQPGGEPNWPFFG